MKERKDLIDDALHATKAAAEEASCPAAASRSSARSKRSRTASAGEGDEKLGFDIVAEALKAPPRRSPTTPAKTARSSSPDPREQERAYGYNAATDEYVDMFKAGIIDPTKVATTALLNAASAIWTGADDGRADDGTEGPEGRRGPARRWSGVVSRLTS
jgi:chaperonin GroEL